VFSRCAECSRTERQAKTACKGRFSSELPILTIGMERTHEEWLRQAESFCVSHRSKRPPLLAAMRAEARACGVYPLWPRFSGRIPLRAKNEIVTAPSAKRLISESKCVTAGISCNQECS
jgi:hypothetical protein